MIYHKCFTDRITYFIVQGRILINLYRIRKGSSKWKSGEHNYFILSFLFCYAYSYH